MKEIDVKRLEILGLSKNESKVYMELLKLGSASVSDIAIKADVHRVNIYDALKRLEEKGLVASITKDEKKYFEAASPKEIERIAIDKQKELDEIKNMVPDLMEVFAQEKKKQSVHHYFGKNGLKTIYNHMIELLGNGGELKGLGSTGVMRDIFPIYMNQFMREIVNNNITAKVLYYDSSRKASVLQNMTARYLPKDMQFIPMTIYLYNGWVAIISLDAMIGIEIQSQEMYNNFLKYFEWLWRMSKE